MLERAILSKNWLASCESYEDSNLVLVGIPFDGTCSFRPGTRFAAQAIRLASFGLEQYSPNFNQDLENVKFYDLGELDLPFGNKYEVLDIIKKTTKKILEDGKLFFGIGGEHLSTLPIVQTFLEKYPHLQLIHFDAHTDLRDEYLGEKLSHATVIKRILDQMSPKNLMQIGIRSGEKPEFEFMKQHNTFIKTKEEFKNRLEKIGNAPIFITLDIDVLDPSVIHGTGTPEPGGFTFNELIDWLFCLKNKNIVGMDLNELSPDYDQSGVSTIVAAKLVREMLCLCYNNSQVSF